MNRSNADALRGFFGQADIMEIDYDDYFGMYYWIPAINTIPSGLYDTKDNAIQSAMEALKIRKIRDDYRY